MVKLTLTGLTAMAVTLAIFAAAQVAMPLWVRPHLIPLCFWRLGRRRT